MTQTSDYHGLLFKILQEGEYTGDRTGTGTKSLFGTQVKFDLRDGFPLLTTKKMHTKAIIHELLWFLKGETNIKYLTDNGVNIWNEWADEDGELGPVYGSQWRNWNGIDQIATVIERIKTNPDCRRLIVTAWNPNEIDDMALPPCHCLFQFKVYGDTLNLQLYQRSCDVFLGVPFNIASYALLLEMVAQVTGLKAGVFTHTYGDVHIYNNHMDQVKEQLARNPYEFESPKLVLNKSIDNIDDFTYDDISIEGYESCSAIKAPISV